MMSTDVDESSENLSSDDYEDEFEDSDEEESDRCTELIQWTGPSKKIPVVLFKPDALLETNSFAKVIGQRYKLAFKIVKTECKIVRSILSAHGFHEVHPNSLDFNLMWTGSHLKPYILRAFTEFQKINHFPRSYELTRKDRLYKNIQRMQHIKGVRHFDFIPTAFVIPLEFGDFQMAYMKDKGPWIVKPVASSRGRGIFLINHPSQLPTDETLLVSRYISNPLLVDNFKFDLRMYILVTSFDPLQIYLYEEGMARFASHKYDASMRNLKNHFIHLTNYSVNKRNPDFVRCDDPDVEDYGNKWTMSAMLRYLKKTGRDTSLLMSRIEDLIVKTMIAGEMSIATSTNMFQPHRSNCFELFGFDVLVDENLKPWLMEVNLSPSLACEAPIDLKIKGNMLTDLFSLVGFIAQDPIRHRANKRNAETKSALSRKPRPTTSLSSSKNLRAKSASLTELTMTPEENRVLRMAREEYKRRGGWVRLFPTQAFLDQYAHLSEHKSSLNVFLYSKLYPNRTQRTISRPASSVAALRSKCTTSGSISNKVPHISESMSQQMKEHIILYERRLVALGDLKPKLSSGRKKAPKADFPDGSSVTSKQDINEQSEKKEFPETANLQQGQVAFTQPLPNDYTSDEENRNLTNAIISRLESGRTLSVPQAREAFATYLSRVQVRLYKESQLNASFTEKSDEQMCYEYNVHCEDLVLRFLKRASQNLSQVFRVVVPSRKLPISERRRILAKQLADFVIIYNRDTVELLGKTQAIPPEDAIASDVFDSFVRLASESELEEVLTTFTKLNRSASIFLGRVKSESPKIKIEHPKPTVVVSKPHDDDFKCIRIEQHSERKSSASVVNAFESRCDNSHLNYPISEQHSPESVTQKPSISSSVSSLHRTCTPPLSRKSKNKLVPSGLEETIKIYSESLTRPHTTSVMRSFDRSEEAIAQALQRLARKQASRQYAPKTSVLENVTSMHSNNSLKDAWGASQAYSLVTGVPPVSNNYNPTPASSQYRLIQQKSSPDPKPPVDPKPRRRHNPPQRKIIDDDSSRKGLSRRGSSPIRPYGEVIPR